MGKFEITANLGEGQYSGNYLYNMIDTDKLLGIIYWKIQDLYAKIDALPILDPRLNDENRFRHDIADLEIKNRDLTTVKTDTDEQLSTIYWQIQDVYAAIAAVPEGDPVGLLPGLQAQLAALLAQQTTLTHTQTSTDKSIEDNTAKIKSLNDQITALHEKSKLELELVALLKQQAALNKVNRTQTATLWCPDYSTELSGIVGTIERDGDPSYVDLHVGWDTRILIRPGYPAGNSSYVTDRDGQAVDIRAMSPEQAFYTMAIMPGWQKWLPGYRSGTIYALSVAENKCSVLLDNNMSTQSDDRETGPLPVNQELILTGLSIDYMTCGASAFAEGDRVIVEFEQQDLTQQKDEDGKLIPIVITPFADIPKRVIGFVTQPKPCGQRVLIFQPYMTGANYYLGVYERTDPNSTVLTRIYTYDLHTITGGDPTAPIFVNLVHGQSNSIYAIGSQWIAEYGGFYAPIGLRIPILCDTGSQINQVVYAAGNGDPAFNGLAGGGYRVLATGVGVGINNWLAGHKIRQDIGTFNFEVVPAVWTDANHDGIAQESEKNPLDYEQYETRTRGIAWNGPDLLICYFHGHDTDPSHHHNTWDAYNDASMVRCRIAKFWPPPYDAPLFYWRGADPAFLDLERSSILEIGSVAAFERINQILCHDDRLIVVRRNPVSITIYDMTGTSLVSRSFSSWGEACVVNLVIVGCEYELACQFYNVSPLNKSSLYYLRIDTLETMAERTVPDAITTGPYTMAVVNGPTFPAFLEVINTARVSFGSGRLAHSPLISSVAQAHANWCVDHARMSHIGADDQDVHYRLYDVGIFYAAENLAIADSAAQAVEFAQVIDNWKLSPGHLANMIFADDTQMGFGVATYPNNVHEITIGPGRYLDGSYTTTDTVWVLDPSQYGKVRIYVYNSCEW